MKTNIFLTTIITASLFSLTACDNFLTETDPNHIVAENYFSTENDVERAVNGAYLALRSGSCMGEGSTTYTEERSDNTGRLDNQSAAGEPFQFTDFSLLPSNTYLKSHWQAMFKTVKNANFSIQGAEKVAFDNDETKQNYIAEARFVRALVYFDIVRKWGDAPLITDDLTTPAEITAHTYREDKAKIYQQIVDDLKFVLEKSTLPNHQPEDRKGHANKAAAAGLLGKVYLTMAHVLDNSQRSKNLKSAQTYLDMCYQMKEFGNLNEISYSEVFDVATKSTCKEILFQIVYKQGDKDYSSSIAERNYAEGGDINITSVVKKGEGTYVNPDIVSEFETAENNYIYPNNNEDKRRKWSIGRSEIKKQYYITKFRDLQAGESGYGGNDWIILRYADVILMLAEVNEALNQDKEAINYLNMVRTRAGLPDYETSKSNPTYNSKFPTLKLAILHERRSELAFENQRWYDLLRFFTPEELVTYMHAKDGENYGISNLQNFTETDIYYPIPYDEWKLNPEGMYQNPGY